MGTSERGRRDWLSVSESGTVFGIRAIVVLATALGRLPVRLVMRIVALYYTTFHKTARRASQDYLRRVGVRSGFWDSYRHIFCFAQCSSDRLFFLQGRHRYFEATFNGNEHLKALVERGQGAILLGAHLGSFEAMGAAGADEGIRVTMVVYSRSGRKIAKVLSSFRAGAHARILEADPGDVSFAFKLRDCVERGELVGILGDRILGGKSTQVDFLGQPALLPTGPYLLASVVRCPIYLTFGLFEGPNRYHLHCEPFAESVVLPRGEREAALRSYTQRFADRLGAYCQRAPHNWFNFYDFWDTRPRGANAPRSRD